MSNKSDLFFYPIYLKFSESRLTFLWYSCANGDFLLAVNGVLLFLSENTEDAVRQCDSLSIIVRWSESQFIDYDLFISIFSKIKSGMRVEEKDCGLIMEGWNLVDDLVNTFSLSNFHKILSEKKLIEFIKNFFTGQILGY